MTPRARDNLISGLLLLVAVIFVLVVLFISGCAASSIQVRERDAIHRAPHPGWVITILGTVYVPPPLADWTTEPLPNSRASVMVHECVHASRQIADGEASALEWLALYALDPGFRWNEERLAYEAEIRYLAGRGVFVGSPYWRRWFVGVVTDPTYRAMVAREDAERWYDGFTAGLRPSN